MEFMLKNVRIAFANVVKPKSTENGLRYSAAFIINPESAVAFDLTKGEDGKPKNTPVPLMEIMNRVAKAKWEDKAKGILATLLKNGNTCYKEDAAADSEGNVYDGFEGMFTLNAGQAEEKGKPLVIDRKKDANGQWVVLTERDGKPYSGCYVNVKLDFWAQDNSADRGGKRINAQIKTVQFVEDGDAFGGGTPASAEGFEDLGEGTDADELI